MYASKWDEILGEIKSYHPNIPEKDKLDLRRFIWNNFSYNPDVRMQ